MQSVEPVLDIQNLDIDFTTPDGMVRAVDGMELTIQAGETVALVGESGSGKSVTCLSIMGLLGDAGKVTKGKIRFKGTDVLELEPARRRSLRGSGMSMVFQEPMTSLNPVFRIGSQISESIQVHSDVSGKQAQKEAERLLDLVRIPEASRRLRNYPHELSGGMRQRVMIAMALAGSPDLLIADEPTTALDVTVQAQIIELLASLQKDLGMALLFVTHDLGVVAGMADRVSVMYGGQIVETSKVDDLFKNPLMPYTAGLLRSVPVLVGGEESGRLKTIPGKSPIPDSSRSGCTFAPRCDYVLASCRNTDVPLETVGERAVRCLRSSELTLL